MRICIIAYNRLACRHGSDYIQHICFFATFQISFAIQNRSLLNTIWAHLEFAPWQLIESACEINCHIQPADLVYIERNARWDIYVRQRLYVFQITSGSQWTYKAEQICAFFGRGKWTLYGGTDLIGFSFCYSPSDMHCLISEMDLNGFYRDYPIIKAFNHYYLLNNRNGNSTVGWCLSQKKTNILNIESNDRKKSGRPLAFYEIIDNSLTLSRRFSYKIVLINNPLAPSSLLSSFFRHTHKHEHTKYPRTHTHSHLRILFIRLRLMVAWGKQVSKYDRAIDIEQGSLGLLIYFDIA